MWKKSGDTEKVYAARNIITNKMPVENKENDGIEIVGIYYSDSESDIYMNKKKNIITDITFAFISQINHNL